MLKRTTAKPHFWGYGLSIVALMLSACTTPFLGGYGEYGQTKEEFTRYVEAVFRLQNNVTSELMLVQDVDDADLQTALSAAEQNMHQACAALNEYAERDSDGLNIGLLLQRKVEKSAADCEQAALKVKALLAKP